MDIFPTFLSSLAARYACINNTEHGCDYWDEPISSDEIARVEMGDWSLKPSSYAAAMISLSGLFQAVSYISIGAIADYSWYQYYLFRVTAVAGAVMAMIWIFFDHEVECVCLRTKYRMWNVRTLSRQPKKRGHATRNPSPTQLTKHSLCFLFSVDSWVVSPLLWFVF